MPAGISEVAKELREAMQAGNVPPGLIIKAANELDRMQRKLEQAIVPWAGFTDRLKIKNGDND
jgi:hypothetical protein